MLNSILSSATTPSVSMNEFFICAAVSVLLGAGMAGIHTYKNTTSRNFVLTIALLPVVVQSVIMLVNGNLGTGVAVMGAFSLVRFRSLPGNSREIIAVFVAMGMGLATGMGYLGVAVWLFLITAFMILIILSVPMPIKNNAAKELKITIPENLDYYGIFDDLFERYTSKAELLRVRTVQMGSLYELQYHVNLKSEVQEKEFLDCIRCRNGNLNLVCGRIPAEREEL